MDPNPSVAFIITHTIKAGEEARYEGWLTEMLHVVSRAPGYLGREVFRPAPGRRTYTSIVRFDAADQPARVGRLGGASSLGQPGQ